MWVDSRSMHLSFSQRKRGDIACYPGRAAIYLGNDWIIEAANPTTGVHVSSVHSTPPTSAGAPADRLAVLRQHSAHAGRRFAFQAVTPSVRRVRPAHVDLSPLQNAIGRPCSNLYN